MRSGLWFCCLLSLPLFATTTHVTRIHDVDLGERPGDIVLVLLSNGRVAQSSVNDSALLDRLQRARLQQELVRVEVNDDLEVTELGPALAEEPLAPAYPVLNEKSELVYVPTVIPSPDEARRIFRDRRSNNKDSQCFNRAHVWSYEWRVKHQLFSQKAWIFFSRKFLRSQLGREPKFDWWFHVAPMALVSENGAIRERVLDVKYSSQPLPLQSWANIFMRGKGPCKTVGRYSEHANFPYEGYCYFQKTSMYYYIPADLEALENFGRTKTSWVEAEVREAYREAFDIHL
jgi:hypothetical protein